MKALTTEGTCYERYPWLLCTPFAFWDYALANMWNAYIDAIFASVKRSTASFTPMGDFESPTKP